MKKKFWRAFYAIMINVIALPLDVIAIIVMLICALYCEITESFGKGFIQSCYGYTKEYTKELINWVNTGKWN